MLRPRPDGGSPLPAAILPLRSARAPLAPDGCLGLYRVPGGAARRLAKKFKIPWVVLYL